jgi:colanic acid/amylovoran biosynthesis glycosyltransferase
MTEADIAQPVSQPTRRLRIGYLTNQYPAVSHTFIRRELREIERRGHEVHRFAIRQAAAAPVDSADKEEFGKTFHVLSQPKSRLVIAMVAVAVARPWAFVRALRKTVALARRSDRGFLRHLAYLAEAAVLLPEMKARRLEHVHVHFGTNAAAVALLLRHLGGPTYSITIHGPDEFDAPVGLSLADKVGAASFVSAISDFCRAQICRWIPMEEWGKVHVVRCTVGEQYAAVAAPIDPATRSLVCVGRLNAQKGHRVLLEGFAQAVKSGVDAKLVLCGDGELRPEVERIIRDTQIQDRVEITGWVDEAEVRRRLLQSRALILPSFAEGLPMVIMEAFALGRPVISTRIAGIPELVRAGENGWLITAGRADQVAGAIRELMATTTRRLEEMALLGRQSVLEHHNTRVEGEKLERLFMAAAGER